MYIYAQTNPYDKSVALASDCMHVDVSRIQM